MLRAYRRTSKKIYNKIVNIQFAYSAACLRSTMRGCKFMKVTGKRVISSVLAMVSIFGIMSSNICAADTVELARTELMSEQNSGKLPAPTGFKGNINAEFVEISWEPVEGAEGYYIYRYDEYYGDYRYIGSSAEPSYTVTGLQRNSSYKFKICACKNDSIGELSEAIKVKTLAVPTPVIKKDRYDAENEFSWDYFMGAKYYKVYKYSKKAKEFKYIAKVETPHFTDENAKGGATNYYKVAAVTDEGVSKCSAIYKLSIPKLETPKATAKFNYDHITVAWDEVPNATQYYIYKYSTKKKKYILINKQDRYVTSFYDDNIKDGKTYNYKIRAVNDYGKSNYSQRASIHIPAMKLPTAPVIASYDSSTYSVSFSWNPVKNADFYIVYQYNPKTQKYEEFDTTTGTGGSIHMLSENTTYYFKVAAKNMKGIGPKSKQITITTKKSSSGSSSNHSLTWVCPACGTTNYDFGGLSFACTNCKNMKPTKDTWTCPRCGTTNFNWGLGICSKCKNLKP